MAAFTVTWLGFGLLGWTLIVSTNAIRTMQWKLWNGPALVPQFANGTIIPPELLDRPHVCLFDGRKYYDGEEILLMTRYGTRDTGSCLKCICKKGFNGNLTPQFCQPPDCELQLYYPDKLKRGCNPVYFQAGNGVDYCCPVRWQCRDENQAIPESPAIQSKSVSIFGLLTISPFPNALNNQTKSKYSKYLKENVAAGFSRQATGYIQIQEAGFDGQGDIHRDYNPPELRICKLGAESGAPCGGAADVTRFYYDYASEKCQPFRYSGCGGNANNFQTFDKCHMKCGQALVRLSSHKPFSRRTISMTQ